MIWSFTQMLPVLLDMVHTLEVLGLELIGFLTSCHIQFNGRSCLNIGDPPMEELKRGP